MNLPDDKPRVLLVDDEQGLLDGLRRHLRTKFEVETANSGAEGIDKITNSEPFAVIMSDYQMPVMNGAAFLSEARKLAPETTRMLFTGQADLNGAAAVINEGGVFRFLLKPVRTDELIANIEAGVEQTRLMRVERELLEQTLAGSIKAMSELLSLASPGAFARATRMRALAALLFDAAKQEQPWHVAIALTLSQIGAIALPPSVLERLDEGKALSPDEAAMVERMPDLAEQVLSEIPRLERVRLAIMSQDRDCLGRPAEVPIGARVLRLVRDYDMLESAGSSPADAIRVMQGRAGAYDPALFQALVRGLADRGEREVEMVPLARLDIGMTLADDVFTAAGVKLVPRGHVVSPSLLERITNFAAVAPGISEPLCVFAARSEVQAGAA